jgi:hypothetical protein
MGGENFVAHLDGLGGTPVCRGTPVAHHCPNIYGYVCAQRKGAIRCETIDFYPQNFKKAFGKCVWSTREQIVRFAYVTSLFVEGKQTHMLCKPYRIGTETASYKVLSLGNNVYSMDRICFLICYPSDPLSFTSSGRRTHRFAPTTILTWGTLRSSGLKFKEPNQCFETEIRGLFFRDHLVSRPASHN